MIIAKIFKSALWSIIGNLIKESVMAVFGKLRWKVLLERSLSRLLVYILVSLRGLSSNELWQTQLDDIIKVLTNPDVKLPEIEKQYQRLANGMEINS